MKEEERDNLLCRLDERTQNIWRSIEDIKTHQETQNNHILTSLTYSRSNRLWIKIISGIGGASIILFLTYILR